MCRHLAYVGPAAPLGHALWRAPHALVHQARTPRHQISGHDNPDGWGVAWRDPDVGAWRRYRTTTPMWDDHRGCERLAAARGSAFVAAARLASPGAPVEESGNAPFVSGKYAFSLNGYVADFALGVGDVLRKHVSEARLAGIEGHADTEVLFAMVLDRLDRGASPADALADTIVAVEAVASGRLNCLLHDGETVVATVVGNSLFSRPGWLASEPLDDDRSWRAVPDRSLVVATAGSSPREVPLP